VKTSRVIRRLQLCVIFGVCDSVRLLKFPCYITVSTSADRLRRLVWSDCELFKSAIV
jgi:hypothetical protein